MLTINLSIRLTGQAEASYRAWCEQLAPSELGAQLLEEGRSQTEACWEDFIRDVLRVDMGLATQGVDVKTLVSQSKASEESLQALRELLTKERLFYELNSDNLNTRDLADIERLDALELMLKPLLDGPEAEGSPEGAVILYCDKCGSKWDEKYSDGTTVAAGDPCNDCGPNHRLVAYRLQSA